ncbi:MAG: hypothetical protein IT198_13445 [Acidimicrobiia bacterium]|nr:hypothetical protein [Acidimicrobiia bacterium]
MWHHTFPACACLVEPLAVAVHGWGLSEATEGMRVAVVGAGTIGLCAVASATSTGLDVDLVARHPHQMEAGTQLGARIRASDRYDVVVDAAGTQGALAHACELVRPGGTVLVLGTHWGTMHVSGLVAVVKELRFVCPVGCGYDGDTREIDVAARILATRPEIATALVTHRFPLDEATEAFRVAADRESGAIEVVLEP